MSDYAMQAEGEMWDTISSQSTQDTASRLHHSSRDVAGHTVSVARIVGSRLYVVAVDGLEYGSRFDWTTDAIAFGVGLVEADPS